MLLLKFFAETADSVGTREKRVPHLPTPRRLVEELPELAPLRRSKHVQVAVNQTWAEWTTPLQDGDEVAFLPPVSGG